MRGLKLNELALFAGAGGGTAQEAVKFASLFDSGCGSGMDFLKLEA